MFKRNIWKKVCLKKYSSQQKKKKNPQNIPKITKNEITSIYLKN